MMQVALIENIQREDLNAIEEAEGYAILNSKYGLSHDEIANTIGKNGPQFQTHCGYLNCLLKLEKVLEQGKFLLDMEEQFCRKKLFLLCRFFGKNY